MSPQWEAADTEIKVPSVENTEREGSLFKAWGGSVYSHTCYANCQSIHLHLFQNLQILSGDFLVLAVAHTGSCVGRQNKIGHPAGSRFPCRVPAEYK